MVWRVKQNINGANNWCLMPSRVLSQLLDTVDWQLPWFIMSCPDFYNGDSTWSELCEKVRHMMYIHIIGFKEEVTIKF